MCRRIERWAVSAFGGRGCAVLLACLSVVLIFGVVALAAAGPTPSFADPKHYPTARGPGSVAIGDLNGDSKPDIATSNYDAGSVSVLLSNGRGGFRARRDYAVGSFPTSVVIGDLDGDGKPDLVTANGGSLSSPGKTVSVLLNKGGGDFGAKLDYETGNGTQSVAIGDLNGDTKPDLATTNFDPHSDTVSVLLNRGDGSFLPRVDYAAASAPYSVAIGDLNADNKPDLATANSDSDSVSVFFNTGDGSFEARRDHPLGGGGDPQAIAVGDLNADGRLDLATASYGFNSLSVLLNRGNGTFSANREYGDIFDPVSIAIGDLNGDGKPELATTSDEEDFVFVLTSKGDGSFRTDIAYSTGHAGADDGVAIGDLNGDGKRDLATASGDVNSVSVLLNAAGLCKIPNVKGKTLPTAKRVIAHASCRVGTIRRDYSKAVKRGRVISQKPKAGTVLPKGGKVELVVSRGQKH